MIGIGFAARAKRCGRMKAGSKSPTGRANHFNSFSKIYESCPQMRLCFISPFLAMVPDALTRLPILRDRLLRHQRLPFMEFWRLISDKGLSAVCFQALKLMES